MITDFRDSNLITDSFNSVLQDCAKQSAKFINKVPTQKIRKSNTKPWLTQSCTDLRNTVKIYEKLVNKNPHNGQYRKLFYTYRSKFRKHEEKMYKQNIYNDMSNNIDKNPKTFWNMLNKLEKLHTNHDSVHTYSTTISFSSLRN